MKRSSLRAAIVIAASVAVVQGLAVLVYREVEARRRAAGAAEFRAERLSPQPAADLELLAVDGSIRRLSELRGRAVVLHFWATWCPPCREELPGLLELGRELRASGKLELVALSLDAEWAPVREFFDGDVPPEVVRDARAVSKAEYDLSTLPDTYLLAADGSLRLRFGGARDWRSEAARHALLEASDPSPRRRAGP